MGAKIYWPSKDREAELSQGQQVILVLQVLVLFRADPELMRSKDVFHFTSLEKFLNGKIELVLQFW